MRLRASRDGTKSASMTRTCVVRASAYIVTPSGAHRNQRHDNAKLTTARLRSSLIGNGCSATCGMTSVCTLIDSQRDALALSLND
jgi:hypothetical protein